MVSTPLKNISHLGWWHSQYIRKVIKFHGSSHHQPVIHMKKRYSNTWKDRKSGSRMGNFPSAGKSPSLWLSVLLGFYRLGTMAGNRLKTTLSGWWCNNHVEKWWSQWEGWQPIYEMDNKSHVWNHQPAINEGLQLAGTGIYMICISVYIYIYQWFSCKPWTSPPICTVANVFPAFPRLTATFFQVTTTTWMSTPLMVSGL